MSRAFLTVVGVVVLALAAMAGLTFLVIPDPSAGTDAALVARIEAVDRNAAGGIGALRRALASSRPRGAYIVIDTHANRLFLRTSREILLEAVCSTGSGDSLYDSSSGRGWRFDTPRGVFQVTSKLEDPWWRKPDWAFIEEGEPIPEDVSERMDPDMLGEYALGFGDGYFIHGTLYQRLLGVNVTHGCVRLATDDLRKLYRQTLLGTRIYVF